MRIYAVCHPVLLDVECACFVRAFEAGGTHGQHGLACLFLPLDGRYACLYGLVSWRYARAVRSCSVFSVCPAVTNEDVCLLKLGGLLCIRQDF